MKIYIGNLVYKVLDDFYDASMKNHITLDYLTVLEKIDRLERALYDFAPYAEMVNNVPYRREWQNAGYKEFYTEGFHFAYDVYYLHTGEQVVFYCDAVHDLMNINPEEK